MAEAPPPAIDPAIEADPEVNRLLAALQLMVRIADCMSQLSTDESDSTLGDDVCVTVRQSGATKNVDGIARL